MGFKCGGWMAMGMVLLLLALAPMAFGAAKSKKEESDGTTKKQSTRSSNKTPSTGTKQPGQTTSQSRSQSSSQSNARQYESKPRTQSSYQTSDSTGYQSQTTTSSSSGSYRTETRTSEKEGEEEGGKPYTPRAPKPTTAYTPSKTEKKRKY